MNVFAYGSLMFAPVWSRVVRGGYRSLPAALAGYRRHAIDGETYPAAVADPAGRIEGRLWLDVSDDDVARLDAFEGADYRRIAVTAVTAESIGVDAALYLYLPLHRLLEQDWDPARFERESMASFARDYMGFDESG